MGQVNFYKWLYTHLTPWIKRPWTWASRDVYHQVEYLVLMACLFSGFFTGYFWAKYDMCLWWLLALWGVSTVWFVLGHFFWGRQYIPNQGTEDEGEWEDN